MAPDKLGYFERMSQETLRTFASMNEGAALCCSYIALPGIGHGRLVRRSDTMVGSSILGLLALAD